MTGKILAREHVNMGRQFEVDLARALAIFTMVLVHVFERLDWYDVLGHPVSVVVEFAGGPLSAPVFMTAMGIGIAYSGRRNAAVFAARGKALIRQGYALNLWRGGLVYLVLYTLTGEDSWLREVVGHMLVLDILQFAGAAFLLLALLWRLGAKPWQLLLTAIVMEAAATATPPVVENQLLPAGILGYFFYQDASTCFPLFSWFIYPAAGYCFGLLLQRAADKTALYRRCLLLCGGLFALLTALLLAVGYDVSGIFLSPLYYAQGLVRATWILLVCGMLYGLLYFVSLGIGQGRLRAVIQFMSGKVNDIYIYQWVIIMWLCYFVLADVKLTAPGFWVLTAGVLALSVLLAYGKQRWAARREEKAM